MAISLVQTGTASITPNGSILMGTLPSNVTAGNFLVLGDSANVSIGAGTISSIQDSQGNSWIKANGFSNGNLGGELWYVQNSIGGSFVGTVTWNNTQGQRSFIVREYSGLSQSSPLDVTSLGTSGNAAGTVASGTIATTLDTELLVLLGGWGAQTTGTVSTGFGNSLTVNNNSQNSAFMADQITSLAGNYAGTWTASNNTVRGAIIASFKPAGTSGAPILTNLRSLMGVGY